MTNHAIEIKTISAEPDSIRDYIGKLWKYRSLILTFAKRDLKVKYAQTYFGILWILLQPIPSVVVFTFFFNSLIKVDTGILPYPVFALLGMIGWTYFTSLTSGVGNALIESQHILKKIYFPKLILPFSKVLTGAVDFLISFIVLSMAMILFNVTPSANIVLLPVFILYNILAGFAIGIWISALTFRYRDMQHIAPFIINFSIWLTPVFYPTTVLPDSLIFVMYFNPMALVVAGYRFALGNGQIPDYHLLMSVIPTLILLGSGLFYFRKVEDEIADFI
jgi:lipopolysaccharide transport system permease protein